MVSSMMTNTQDKRTFIMKHEFMMKDEFMMEKLTGSAMKASVADVVGR